MSDSAGGFRKGAEAAQKASKGGNFAKTHYFSLDGNPNSPENSVIVRFLTDQPDWIVVDQHQNISTKQQPPDWPDGRQWPGKMGSVCRGDVAFGPPNGGTLHDGSKAGRKEACYICDHLVDGKIVKNPSARTWALAVLREEVVENGQVVGLRDKTRDVAKVDDDGKPTGDTTTEKAIVVVNMGYKNFFAALSGFAGHHKTILDRDYLIKRSGTDETTTYQIIPLDPIDMDTPPANPANPKFPNRFDLRNDEHMARYPTDLRLEDIVSERASDEFYARFFDKRVASPPMKKAKGGDSDAAPSVPKPEADVPSEEKMAALASRVKGYGTTSGDQAAPSEQAKEPVAAAAGAGGMKDFG